MDSSGDILAILSEYLRKTDQMLEQVKQQNEEIISLRKDYQKDMIDLRKDFQSESLKNDIRIEALMQEIFRISKRVNDIENKG